MKSPESRMQIMQALQDAIVDINQNLVLESAQRAVDEGVDACDAIINGLVAGMRRVAELNSRGEYFLPEVTMCADAFNAGLEILRPHLRPGDYIMRGKAVIGTIEGDKHDIGKNLVKVILEVAGFTVYDLGVDVPPEKFVQASLRWRADLVCLSATMTTTALSLRQIIDMLRLSSPKIRILVGGNAVSAQDARKWGVEAYAEDWLSLWQVLQQLQNSPEARGAAETLTR